MLGRNEGFCIHGKRNGYRCPSCERIIEKFEPGETVKIEDMQKGPSMPDLKKLVPQRRGDG